VAVSTYTNAPATPWRGSTIANRSSVDRVATLDALRGIAALTVALSHGREVFFIGTMPYLKAYPFDLWPSSLLVYLTAPLMSGAIGVSLFFILSGYVIHRSYAPSLAADNLTFDAPTFLMRRMIRIYPTLLLALLVTFLCDSLTRTFVLHHNLGDVDLWSLLVNVLSLQGLLGEPYGSNSPLWSLAIEMQFYLVYPLALMVRRRISATAMLGVAAGISLLGALVSASTTSTVAFPQYYIAWWIGAYMADREAAGQSLPRRWQVWSTLLIAFGCITYQLQYWYIARIAWAVGLAPVMMAVIHRADPRLSQNAVLGWLGQCSYTLYAVHFPIIVLLSAMIFGGVKQPQILWSLLLTGVAIAACYPAYLLAERPSIQLLERVRHRRATDVVSPRITRVCTVLSRWVEHKMGSVMRQATKLWNGSRQRLLARHLQVAVASHPVFQPPHLDRAQPLTRHQANANYGYFLSQRMDRAAHMTFLLSKFGVDSHDRVAVDAWVARYGTALLPTWQHAGALRHTPLWNGRFATLNLVHDLAVLTGETAIRSNTGWHWAQSETACASGAVLTNGRLTLDLVQEVADICLQSELRPFGLRGLRQKLARG
jgi:peptidoglycan/LPS O-acetylase OafA/YrhL